MKILIAAPAWPYRGGIAEFSNRLAGELTSEGHDAEIFTFTLQYPGFLFPGKTQFTESPAPDDVKITRIINSVNPFNWLTTGRKIKKIAPDILILRFWLPFMGPALGTIARIARSNKKTKVICIFDNVVPHEKRPGDVMLTKYLVNSIDGAIVMAGSVGNDLHAFRKDMPVSFNPHPIYDSYGKSVSRTEALSSLQLRPEPEYLLFFGFIRAYKGLDILIEALSDERLMKRNIKLLVAGEFYEDRAIYEEQVKNLGLEKKIVFYDHFIKNDEVASFFSVSDIVVQPYKSATQSGVTQIAYNFEKPMLVTDVGGLREIVPDKKCGYVVNPDPKSIADALTDYFENNRKESFTECVREEKKRFGWDRMVMTITGLYIDVTK
jgi:D-inositol-3-phosphate glycosyltransferase